jgi:serine/threonine protein kinase
VAGFQFTPYYAAPEVIAAYHAQQQIRAQPSVDIWALGVVMFEVLTGTQIMQYCRTMDELADFASGKKAYPWESAPQAFFENSNTHAMVRECLRRNPALRPSASALKADVESMGTRGRVAAALSPQPSVSPAARSALAAETRTLRTASERLELATLNK